MKKRTEGFTLVEVLIVVVILGVLATLVLPRFTAQDERAYVAEAVTHLSAIRQGEAAYALEHPGSYKMLDSSSTSDDWAEIGIDTPDMTKFTYEVPSTETGTITAQRTGTGTFGGNTIVLSMNGTWSGTHTFKPKN